MNHFVRGNWRQDTINDGQKVKTVGGREVTFGRHGEKHLLFYIKLDDNSVHVTISTLLGPQYN
jgi:uncharacterized surface protein with fasciclin (FAS1) repeats